MQVNPVLSQELVWIQPEVVEAVVFVNKYPEEPEVALLKVSTVITMEVWLRVSTSLTESRV